MKTSPSNALSTWPTTHTSFAGSVDGLLELADMTSKATVVATASARPAGPLPLGTPLEVLRKVKDLLGEPTLPTDGIGTESALSKIAAILTEFSLDTSNPRAAAHLQPPVLTVAVAADVLASAGNSSVDTFDSGPAAIGVERWLIQVLTEMAGFTERADGVLTPGGSLSNLLALMLARDSAAVRLGIDVRHSGVSEIPRPVVLCSELAHFSVHRACAALGIGERSVQTVATNRSRQMRADELRRQLSETRGTVLAVVATAGTTDYGSFDQLVELSQIARENGVWLHVDAAYGFGALFSERLAPKLDGIHLADSITVDLHKIGWQPAPTSALLVRDTADFSTLDREVPYLNPQDDIVEGYDGLLGRSLQTTRRPDAVKAVATMLAYGRSGLGRMVDTCSNLARYAERRIRDHSRLELVSGAELSTVVFRFTPRDPSAADHLNGALRRRLIRTGTVLIGRTDAVITPNGTPSTCLKLTLLNPNAVPHDIDEILDDVVAAGDAEESAA